MTTNLAAAVSIEDVTYAYPGQDEPVLRGLSLALAPASFTLVVGASGTGKSTMLRLVNGLFRTSQVADSAAPSALAGWIHA